ncbi:transposase [Serpentinicella sp. ANB-PHB4]|uniref:transposase n=1 Tax=Serpentinicella sp. ANB-PHB4 TaxID=3074076 RepID=UPI002857B6FA|nr:transposase [Serpentinicella sp. ANB-PHB4]MDR5658543.1 transposase [Serpentinicella sp. ANB-PHB4]
MPRAARKISSTGIYHIMIRGINRSNIYSDEVDKNKFIEILMKTKEETKFELYAYCLMDNHAHFLLKENEVTISTIMKKVCGTYGAWFNQRHNRVGHVFQDRFKSETVETEAYLIEVAKYILNNPVKAKIVENPTNFKWSSYKEYTNKSTLTDTEFLLSIYHTNKRKAKELFRKEFMKKDLVPINLTIDNIRRTDTEAESIVDSEKKTLGINNIENISVEQRILFIKKLKAMGLTNRQIIAISGLSRNKVIGI